MNDGIKIKIDVNTATLNELTTAIKSVKKEMGDMSRSELPAANTKLKELTDAKRAATGATKGLHEEYFTLGLRLREVAQAAMVAYAAFQTLKQAKDVGELAARVTLLRENLEQLGEKKSFNSVELLNQMERATEGNVKQMDLLYVATRAAMLGNVDMNKLPELLAKLHERSQIFGTDLKEEADAFLRLAESGSLKMQMRFGLLVDTKKVLDDYEITVGHILSQEDKEYALMQKFTEEFLNQAPLKNTAALQQIEVWDRFDKSMETLKISLGSLANDTKIAYFLTLITDFLSKATKFGGGLPDISGSIYNIGGGLKPVSSGPISNANLSPQNYIPTYTVTARGTPSQEQAESFYDRQQSAVNSKIRETVSAGTIRWNSRAISDEDYLNILKLARFQTTNDKDSAQYDADIQHVEGVIAMRQVINVGTNLKVSMDTLVERQAAYVDLWKKDNPVYSAMAEGGIGGAFSNLNSGLDQIISKIGLAKSVMGSFFAGIINGLLQVTEQFLANAFFNYLSGGLLGAIGLGSSGGGVPGSGAGKYGGAMPGSATSSFFSSGSAQPMVITGVLKGDGRDIYAVAQFQYQRNIVRGGSGW